MGFPKSLMSSAVLTGVVFCSATVPLAALNSKTVTVQVNEQPVMMGQLQDFAPPYLGFATLLSLGTGIVSLSALGWRQSAKKLESATDKAKSLEQKLQEQAYAIENLKFSDRRLIASGLDTFLGDDRQTGTAVQPDSLSSQAALATQSNETTMGNAAGTELDERLEQIASFAYGKTASGGDVSSVFKMTSLDDMASSQHANVALHADMPSTHAEPIIESPALDQADADDEQLQALMGQLQHMMSQLEQIRSTQTPAQSAA